jgi:RimJ/RimL family protein N-acetyltransferase
MTALMHRPDGRGVALRFAFLPEARGFGLASEAAGAALRYGHDVARLARMVAVVREDNFASRAVLGSIGMSRCGTFMRGGYILCVYESVQHGKPE